LRVRCAGGYCHSLVESHYECGAFWTRAKVRFLAKHVESVWTGCLQLRFLNRVTGVSGYRLLSSLSAGELEEHGDSEVGVLRVHFA
jgi:hypothetical protein